MEKQYKNSPFAIPEEKQERQIISKHTEEEHHTSLSNKRPLLITIFCSYFFVKWILFVPDYFKTSARIKDPALDFLSRNITGIQFQLGVSGWMGLFFSFLIVASIIGYWLMKKWGAYFYTLSIVFLFIYVLIKTDWSQVNSYFLANLFINFILPLVIIISGFYYLEQMDRS